MSNSGNGDDDSPESLFRQAMTDVKPIRSDGRTRHAPTRPKPVTRRAVSDALPAGGDDFGLSDSYADEEIDHDQALLFVRDGIQQTQLRKLKRGALPISDELDLHGYTVDEARKTLAGFLNHARTQGFRSVRIIHGKGYGTDGRRPVLKSMVNHWLRQRQDVLAFCSAQVKDGGTGAVYVLLRGAEASNSKR